MKLYFYFLEKTRIRCEECDVIEKPKTYYPANRFPNGIYAAFVKKDEVDKIRYYYGHTFIILTEMNKERAAKRFQDKSKNIPWYRKGYGGAMGKSRRAAGANVSESPMLLMEPLRNHQRAAQEVDRVHTVRQICLYRFAGGS